MVRVVFAEDNYLVREGTAALLDGADDVQLVATASNLDELLDAVEELARDAVLTDIRMRPRTPRRRLRPRGASAPAIRTSASSPTPCTRSSEGDRCSIRPSSSRSSPRTTG
jgi:DNA-binding NarL/FixJ family response regulator